MSDTKLYLKMNHPYKKGNAKFKHFEETNFEMNPYSFLLRPFSWTLKDNANEKQKYYDFYFDLEKTEQMLSWSSSWVSHGESQKGIFDYFFSGISPHNSLIFPYYKQVPKSQGSSFGKTIVVISGKSSFVTKELLYTAFSRQREKLIILSDLSIQELVQYANDWYSDTKQRYTDLFEVPNIIEIESSKQKRYFEEKLIHKTIRGEMVRSKSEVIVANILDNMKIEYFYEEPLNIGGRTYIPDFTLRYQGKTAYLEHLGMLGDKSYEKRWNEKRANYESVGISETLGNLIITKDGLDGSLDATLIESKIQTWIKNS